jgi:branched-chain amino acid transport system substrate-binding protein
MNLRQKALAVALAAGALAVAGAAHGADRVRVGFLSTMTGPSGFFGTDARDGFNLLVKSKGGRLGGLPADVVVADDQVNPEVGRQAAERLIKNDRVDFLAGNIFANVLLATLPLAVQNERFVVATIPGPSDLAGEKCSPWFFTAGYQNDTPHEAIGKYLQDKGFKNVATVVPNFVSGRDSVAGMKRYYKGPIPAEIYIKINQLDFSAEIAQLRAASPDAVFIFLPGAMGVNFVKQFQQSGMLGKVPLVGFGFNFEDDIVNATGDATVGAYNALQWSRDLDNPANKAFVEAFEKEYKRAPTAYAALGYDTAQLIDAAVRDVKGKIEDKEAVRRALRAASFQSVRGSFKFGANGMPIQNFYLRQVVKDGNRVVNKTMGTIFTDHVDSFAKSCQMK